MPTVLGGGGKGRPSSSGKKSMVTARRCVPTYLHQQRDLSRAREEMSRIFSLSKGDYCYGTDILIDLAPGQRGVSRYFVVRGMRRMVLFAHIYCAKHAV